MDKIATKMVTGNVFWEDEECEDRVIVGRKIFCGHEEELPVVLREFIGHKVRITVEDLGPNNPALR